MSYEKKSFYPQPPSIELNNCNVEEGSPYLRQNGSMMMVNNKEIQSSPFNVEALYTN